MFAAMFGAASVADSQAASPPARPGGNPIFRDVFTADPAPLVVGDTLYCYVGHDNAKGDEMFTMPGWRVYSTRDMRHWTAHGTVMQSHDFAWAEHNSAWAAQVVEKDGKFYFYTTVRFAPGHPHAGSAIGVAVGDSPTGPFKDALGTALINDGMTPHARKPWNDIDPTVFIDDDGAAWIAWGNGNCYLARLKPSMIELDGDIIDITPEHYTEGPWLFKRGGLYYNVYAAQEPHIVPEQIAYVTAPHPTGPWTYRGILTGPAVNSYTIHPGIVEFKGQWYFFYHNAALTLNGETGAIGRRAVCVEYLFFNPDGTIRPIVQTGEGVGVPPAKP